MVGVREGQKYIVVEVMTRHLKRILVLAYTLVGLLYLREPMVCNSSSTLIKVVIDNGLCRFWQIARAGIANQY